MDHKLSKQEQIQEIKKVSRELENRIMLVEGMKDALEKLKGLDTKQIKFLGSNPAKIKKVLDLLKRSDQLASFLGNIANEMQLAQILQGLMVALKISNPKLNTVKISKRLSQEETKDAKDVEELLSKLGVGEEKEQGTGKPPPPSNRGLISSFGTTGTAKTLPEALGGKQNKLAEMVTRKVMSKLVVK